MKKMKMKKLLILSFLFAIVLTGCTKGQGKSEDTSGDKPVIYTSFYPIYDLTKQIVGDSVELRTFMPIDKDPHLWEPTPRDLKGLVEADLLIVNGANLEKWIDQVRDNLPDLPVLTLSDSIELITYKGAAAIGDFQYMANQEGKKGEQYKFDIGHTHEDIMRVAFIENKNGLSKDKLIELGKKIMEDKGELVPQKSTIHVEQEKVYALEMGHESGEIFYEFPRDGQWVFISDRVSEKILPYDLVDINNNILDLDVLLEGSTSGMDKITYDPHSWLSIENAKMYLNAINDECAKLYPKYERRYQKNKVKAVDQLTDLGVEYKEKLKEIHHQEFVVTHYAYEYLARDFDIIQYPLQGLVSTETPSLKTIKKALEFCNYYGINTIFYEAGNEKKGADTLASEIGGQTKFLTSMEYMPHGQPEKNDSYREIMKDNLEKIYQSLKEVKH
ncbi:MAG: zinc ABC transporter substrate-binding protein [Tissierellia bacterium]|nr:zinc ABC transporter substrate-binding protein [Tissierellia bacterium]